MLHILQYLDEPYKLQGRPVRIEMKPQTSVIIFFKPRLWAGMSTFQIYSATRSQAIKRYGQPSQYSLPFDGSVDSISLPADMSESNSIFDTYFGRYSGPRPMGYFCTLPFRDTSPSFYCEVDEPFASAAKPAKQLNRYLLDRIQCVEIEAGDDSGLCFEYWYELLECLSQCKGLHKLKLKLHQHDNCGELLDEEQEISLFERHDAIVIIGLAFGFPFLESLPNFEIEMTKARCQAPIDREGSRAPGTE
ncbi:hypothetical protein F5B21DRAFT_190033 [Xylaria acuta]|nr:hypothetical protein F5B21DRAFT_190033 [Xylaria acuta]